MTTQFIVNEKGERTSVIIPIDEFEDLVNMYKLHLEPTEEYKAMMDQMIKEEEDGTATYVSLEEIKRKFPVR